MLLNIEIKNFLLFFLLILSSCTINSNVVREENTEINVYFCPQDYCLEKILVLIGQSQDIKCAFYDLDLAKLIDELEQKNADVVIEDSNALEQFHTGHSFALMHNKFCIFDDKIILTGSMNPTERGNYYNNNNIVIIKSKYLAKNYLDEFKELKNNEYGKGKNVKNPVVFLGDTKIENYFCPEDNCKLHVINAIRDAKEIYFMTYSFTDEDIGNLLWNRNYLNFSVKGILEKKQLGKYSRYDDLKEFSIIDTNPYTMHHKVFIVDNKTVITGSYNPTKNANEKNDENLLIIHDKEVAEKYLQEFRRLYYGQEVSSDLKIIDVVYDVPGSDKGKEYVEIKNKGSENINLGYYFLSNKKTNSRLEGKINVNKTVKIYPRFSLINKKGIVLLKKHIHVVDSFDWNNN